MARNIIIDPQRSGTGNPNIQFSGSTGNSIVLEVLSAGTVQFSGSVGSLFTVADSTTGTVSIGTSNSSARLQVSGSSSTTTPTVTIKAGVALPVGAVFDVQDSGGISLLVVSGSGNVGIGTVTPTAGYLDVRRNARFEVADSRIDLVGTYRGFMAQVVDAGSATASYWRLYDLTAAANRVIVDSSGNVGIGTVGLDSRLVVAGTGVFSGSVNPSADVTYDLGTVTKRWRNVYASSISGSITGSNLTAGQVVVVGAGGLLSGSNNFWWENSTGNVGIGTSLLDYSSRLVVAGNSVFSGSVNPDGDLTRDLGSSTKRWRNLYAGNISGSLTGSNLTAGQVVLTGIDGVLSGSNQFFWDNATGNVGIGTNAPNARLMLSGTTDPALATLNVRAGVPNSAVVMNVRNSAGTSLLYVSGSGAVGIGTNAPAYRLDVPTGDASFYGVRVGRGNASIGGNVAVGSGVILASVTTGLDLTAVGDSALAYDSTGDDNTAVGFGALFLNSTGDNNTAVGSLALFTNDTSANSTAVGYAALGNATGARNTALGSGAGYGTTTGNDNIFIGRQAGLSVTTGGSNTIIGSVSGSSTLSNTIILAAGVTERIRVDSNGNVGIGITSMTDKLAVNGTLSVTGSLFPGTSNTYDLGSTTKLWKNVYSTAFSGSLTNLSDGTSYLIAGSNVTITTGSSGAITIASTAAAGTVSGTGTTNYITKWTGTSTIGDSAISSVGTEVGISGSILPGSDLTYNLGSAAKRWNNIFAANISGSLTGSNVSTGQVVVAGSGGVLSGSNLLYWDNTNSRLGIGTSSPAYNLQVAGTTAFSNALVKTTALGTGGTILDVNISAFSADRIPFSITGHASQAYNLIQIGVSAAGDKFVISSVGNVGVGTTSPAAKLVVSGSSTASTPTMIVREGVVSATGGVGAFDVQNSAGSSLLFVSGSGAVGIGTTVSQLPTHKLHISGKIGGGLYTDSSLEFKTDGTTELKANSVLKLGYSLTTVIESSGNVGIGTTVTNGNMLSVNGTAAVSGSILPGTTLTHDLGSSTKYWRDVYARSGSFTGDVSISGNLNVLGTQTIVNSDVVNIKDNIILLNAGPSPLSTGGIYVADTTANTTGSLIWDASTDRWKAGLVGNEINLVTTGSADSLFNKTIAISGTSPNTISGGTQGGIGYFNTSGFLSSSTAGTLGQVLQSAGTSAPTWTNFGTLVSGSNVITGSGTTNYLAKFDSEKSIINSVTYDNGTNVGVGTNTPQDRLQVYGDLRVGLTTPGAFITFGDESTSTKNNGIYRPASSNTVSIGAYSFATINVSPTTLGNQTERLRVDSSGNVGIGTITYSARLFISGSPTSTDPTTIIKAGVVSPTEGAGVLDVQNSAGTSLLFVSGSGFVGVGTNSQTSAQGSILHVSSSLTGNAAASFTVGSQVFNTSLIVSKAHTHLFQGVGGSTNEYMRITSAGNVGIGTSSNINSKLVVNGSVSVTGSVLPGASNTYPLGSSNNLWSTVYATNLTGSLTKLADGTSYIIAGNNIVVSSGVNGSVTVSSTATTQSEYFFSTTAGSIYTTGSVAFVGGQIGIDSPFDIGSTVSFYVSGSTSITGADTPSVIFRGDTFISGAFGISDYLQLKPVGNLRIPTNTSASYIYTSGSTNDLYYTQYQPGTGFTNTVRMRWIEGALSTGLLHGGVLSTANGSTTFSITSGSGLVVDYNASTTTDPYPTVHFVSWPAYVSQSLTYSGSAQITYIGINSSGGLIQQITPFSNNDFADNISIGRVLHQSGSVTNGTITAPTVAYGLNQSNEQFNRAFGPLKVSGHLLQNSGSNLSLSKTSGTSYVAGRNYTANPDSPNLILPSTDAAPTASKIFREYVSGSTPVIDSGIANAGYPTIDPTQYNNNGTLASVSGGQYSNQRVYWFPNSVNKAFFVYYGSEVYATLDLAEAGIASENFTEGANTIDAAIYLGAISVRGNASDLSNTAQARFIQGGLFRSISGAGGGGGGVTIPGGLDTYVQFNDGGSTFGGDAGLTFDKVNHILRVGDGATSAQIITAGSTFDLINTTATTINFAGAASSGLNIGNSSGTNTIKGASTFNQVLNLGGTTSFVTGSLTTSSTSETTLLTISSTTYRSAEFIIQGVNSTDANYMTSKVIAVHNGTTTNFTEYGQVNVGGIAGTVRVTNPSAGSFLLQVTPASTNSTVWKVTAILTKV